ncbi:hypothetical protein [Tenacibaculum sp. C7A-26P2]|uniref:hypothetical protein n=1 Tax=Tenacibaculum sp. C7A-26P2 TaxID=3447504 RepID=UPI003F84BCF3
MIIKRIKELMTYKGYSIEEFSKKIGLDTVELNSLLKHDRGLISEKFLKSILESCPEINFEWLLLGKGEMLLSTTNVKYVKNLDELSPEDILDYVLTYCNKFREEPKIEAVVNIFSNFKQQKILQKMYDKIESYEELLEDKKR